MQLVGDMITHMMQLAYPALLVVYMASLTLQKKRALGAGDAPDTSDPASHPAFIACALLWLAALTLPFWTRPLELFPAVPAAIAGTLCFALGFAVRVAAYRRLGLMFTYDLGQRARHQLITGGIYRWMRHPSYVGSTLMLLGLCVVARSWQMLVAEIVAVVPPMWVRIRREEALLARSFGEEWTRYAASTPRFGL